MSLGRREASEEKIQSKEIKTMVIYGTVYNKIYILANVKKSREYLKSKG